MSVLLVLLCVCGRGGAQTKGTVEQRVTLLEHRMVNVMFVVNEMQFADEMENLENALRKEMNLTQNKVLTLEKENAGEFNLKAA